MTILRWGIDRKENEIMIQTIGENMYLFNDDYITIQYTVICDLITSLYYYFNHIEVN